MIMSRRCTRRGAYVNTPRSASGFLNKSQSQIPPTQLVDRSYSAYRAAHAVPSQIPPTQLVDGSYSAYKRDGRTLPRIPSTQLVDRSYSACVSLPQKSFQQRGRQLSTCSDIGRGLP